MGQGTRSTNCQQPANRQLDQSVDGCELFRARDNHAVRRGSRQRRNWWDILSGGADGKPCVREGIVFPVLRIAQVRQGKTVTPNAISRSKDELPPDVRTTGRWV